MTYWIENILKTDGVFSLPRTQLLLQKEGGLCLWSSENLEFASASWSDFDILQASTVNNFSFLKKRLHTFVFSKHVYLVFFLPKLFWPTTVEHGQIITENFLGEHKVITAEQQFLGLILCLFRYLKWSWILHFSAEML